MKLLEILTEEIIVQPTGTGADRMFNVIDTDNGNRVVSQHRIRGTAERAAERIRAAAPAPRTAPTSTTPSTPRTPVATASTASEFRLNRSAGATLQVVDTGLNQGRFVVVDDANRVRVVFDNQSRASRFAEQLRNGIADGSITNANQVDDLARQSGGQFRRSWRPSASQSSIANAEDLDNYVRSKPRSRIARMVTGTLVKPLLGFLALAGISYSLWSSILINVEEYEEAVREDPDLLQEYGSVEDYANIAFGQLIVQVGAALVIMYRTPARFIRLFRRASNAVALAATVGSGGTGAIPAIIGIILREGAIFLGTYLLTLPSVQDALTKWIINSVFSGFFEATGALAQTSAAALNEITNGLVGSENLRRALGFEKGDPRAAVQGEYVSSSDWAKLVFGPMLFPPEMERQMVPYISPSRREELLSEALDIEASLIDEVEGQADGTSSTPTTTQPETPTTQTDTRSPATQQADPDNDGNADDPEAQVFMDPSVARTTPRTPRAPEPEFDFGPMP